MDTGNGWKWRLFGSALYMVVWCTTPIGILIYLAFCEIESIFHITLSPSVGLTQLPVMPR
jgi:hypothetical protein